MPSNKSRDKLLPKQPFSKSKKSVTRPGTAKKVPKGAVIAGKPGGYEVVAHERSVSNVRS